jgi:GntR family transcriptional regulator/MocR family aminotransferase
MAVMFKVPVNLPLLVELARKVEIGLYPLTGFFANIPPRDGLILGFGAIETLDIDPALDRLREVLTQIG